MAKSTPGTAGSKGGGNVVPGTGFPTRGGVLRSQIPAGRGTVPDNYDYGRNMPSRYPRPMPRPMPGYNRYGGMQGPTGLGGFLSRQPAISQRQIDPATGFPARPQSYGAVMGRPNFGSIGRNTSKGKSGSKGGARTFNPESQAVVDEYNRNPDPTLGKSLPPPTYGTVTGQPAQSMENVQGIFLEQAQNARGMDPYGSQSFKIDPDILDRGTVYRPPSQNPLFGNNPPPSPLQQSFNSEMNSPQYQSALQRYEQSRGQDQDALSQLQASQQKMQGMQDTMGRFGNNPPPSPVQQYTGSPPQMMDAGQYLRTGEAGRGVSPNYTQGLPERPMMQSQGPESLMRMGRAPNIRPAMNVGKATGGPVGLASLIGQY
jgi:hypothetical protein